MFLKTPRGTSEEGHCEEEQAAPQAVVFGQNLRDRVKVFAEWMWGSGTAATSPSLRRVAWGTRDSHTPTQTSIAQGTVPLRIPPHSEVVFHVARANLKS